MTQIAQSIAVIGGTGQLGAAIARRLAKAGKSSSSVRVIR